MLLAACCLLLAACGGGSDSTNGTSQKPDDPPGGDPPGDQCITIFNDDCLDQDEFADLTERTAASIKTNLQRRETDNWARGQVNAYEGYANLAVMKGGTEAASPGKGVHIGFLDTGIHLEHPEFVGTGSGSREFFDHNDPDFRDLIDENLFSPSHGTTVASAAVGFTTGIAWGADITMFASNNPDPASDFTPLPPKLYEVVLKEDLDILNLSLGPGVGDYGSVHNWDEASVRQTLGEKIDIFAQRDDVEKTIIVRSAGNNHNKPCVKDGKRRCEGEKFSALSPHLDGGAVAFIPELQGHFVAVAATDRNGVITTFSNRCGVAAEWCIAAPGEAVWLADYQGSTGSVYSLKNGTSFSAPIVAGGLAVMKQLFRDQLSNTELVSRLFATAKKSGIHANRAVYGQGLMDLGAATNPWGIPAFMGTRSSVNGPGGHPIAASFISLGSPLGDGLTQSLQFQEVAAFDRLGAPFWYQSSNFTIPSGGSSLAVRLDNFLAPSKSTSLPTAWQFNFQENATALGTGHLAILNDASRLTVASPQRVSAEIFHKPQGLEGFTLSYTPPSLPASTTMQVGYLNERHSLLGSQSSGAFGHLSGQTLFLAARMATTTPSGWQFKVQGELGHVSPSVTSSELIDGFSSLSTSAFRLEASRPFAIGSTLRFSLSQPLRVENGNADLSLPTGRTKAGQVVGKNLSAPLSPSGRQLDLSAQLDIPLAGGDFSLGVTQSQQPRHQRRASPEWTFFTGYDRTW